MFLRNFFQSHRNVATVASVKSAKAVIDALRAEKALSDPNSKYAAKLDKEIKDWQEIFQNRYETVEKIQKEKMQDIYNSIAENTAIERVAWADKNQK